MDPENPYGITYGSMAISRLQDGGIALHRCRRILLYGEVHMNAQEERKHDELPISERRKIPCVPAQGAKVVAGRTLQAIRREEETRKR